MPLDYNLATAQAKPRSRAFLNDQLSNAVCAGKLVCFKSVVVVVVVFDLSQSIECFLSEHQ
jgi:hypothetical protein